VPRSSDSCSGGESERDELPPRREPARCLRPSQQKKTTCIHCLPVSRPANRRQLGGDTSPKSCLRRVTRATRSAFPLQSPPGVSQAENAAYPGPRAAGESRRTPDAEDGRPRSWSPAFLLALPPRHAMRMGGDGAHGRNGSKSPRTRSLPPWRRIARGGTQRHRQAGTLDEGVSRYQPVTTLNGSTCTDGSAAGTTSRLAGRRLGAGWE
jgi:hypothetical protein